MVVRARDGEAMRETLIAVGWAVADERGLAGDERQQCDRDGRRRGPEEFLSVRRADGRVLDDPETGTKERRDANDLD